MSLLRNPVIRKPDNEELYRALENLIGQLQRRERDTPRVLTRRLDLSATATVLLIARVGAEGWRHGRASFTFTADITASGTNYWTFAFKKYETIPSTNARRVVSLGSWGTDEHGVTAYAPVVKEYDQPLRTGESLVLVATKTGSPSAIEATIQVDEMYGPEE